jgi:histidine triad (HIT) family protein
MTDCIFCKIAAHTIPVAAVYEDEVVMVFADMHPQAPTHLLAIPKQHYANAGEASAEVLGAVMKAAADVGRRTLPDGFRIVANTGDDGGQTVGHLHLHVLGGRAMHWPPG